jgi:hypothetical protein
MTIWISRLTFEKEEKKLESVVSWSNGKLDGVIVLLLC